MIKKQKTNFLNNFIIINENFIFNKNNKYKLI